MTILLTLVLGVPVFAQYSITCGDVTIYPRVGALDGGTVMELEYRSWLLRRRRIKTVWGTAYDRPRGYHAWGEFNFGGSTYIPTLDIARGADGVLRATLHHFDSERGNDPNPIHLECVESFGCTKSLAR